MTYSQNGEEAALEAFFEGSKPGRLLDIGAFDGKTFSNSAALIDRGWEAVLVEPAAKAFSKLMDRYAGDPKVSLVNALIVPEDRVSEGSELRCFWQCGDAVSTTERGNLEVWSKAGVPFHETLVPALSLYRMLRRFNALRGFDFVSIDTEGTSVAVWRAYVHHMGNALPRALCVEHDGEDILPEAQKLGYRQVYFDGNNIILGKR